MNIGGQVGYWQEREDDKVRKQGKIDALRRRVASCRTFDGLEIVADDARAQGLWHADNGSIVAAVTRCNARLRGRDHPVRYTNGKLTFIVHDNEVVDAPRWFHARNPRALCKEGFRYAGPKE